MRLVASILGFLYLALGASMIPCLLLSLYDSGVDLPGLMLATTVSLGLGGIISLATRGTHGDLSLRQAFLLVTLAWFSAGLLGAFPYYFASLTEPLLAQQFRSFPACFFESVSGFSTTGASILSNIESVPRGLLLWRSLTHWLGGMGIVVLSIAILPLLGGGGMNLFKAEAPGGILPDKLSPRIAQTARSLWWVYILMTIAEIFLLMAGRMSFFDAVCHSFATVATGGFSTRNASLAAFDSSYIHLVVTFFMFLAGVNFFLHFQALRGRPQAYLDDSEFKFYAGVTGVAVLIIFLDVAHLYSGHWLIAFRDALFQVCAITTTTGFATADFEGWPPLSRFLLVGLMVMGGSAGSTAGGSKCLRVMIFFKAGYRELRRLLHPDAVIPVRIGKRVVPDGAVASVLGFMTCIFGLFFLASLSLAALEVDLVTAYTAVIACIFNIGPGLGQVGPTDNFGGLPEFGKILLSFCMILGRLEVYTVLVLFIPEYYRR